MSGCFHDPCRLLTPPALRGLDYAAELPRRPSRGPGSARSEAFTRWDLLAVVASAALLFALVLPVLAASKPRSDQVACFNNLRLIGRAFHIWGVDHENYLPWRTSESLGGTMYSPKVGHAWLEFAWVSNELVAPNILVCPADRNTRRVATEFSSRPEGGFLHANYRNNAVSYWLGMDTLGMNPLGPVCGDRNLRLDAVNAGCSSGLINAASVYTAPSTGLAQWTNGVHQGSGNILVNDGAVRQTSNQKMIQTLDDGDANGITHLLVPR